MGLVELGKVCLFSRMTGVVELDRKPVANAKLIRTIKVSKTVSDETYTDEQGRFEFPVVYKRALAKYLPQEFVANQEVHVQYGGKDYRIW